MTNRCSARYLHYAAALASALTLVSASVASAQDAVDREWLPAIRDSAKAVMARTGSPGVWLVVVDRGEPVISDALGLASVIGPTPLTRETVVLLPGGNDLAIELAMMRLAERGLLDLDAPIGGYVEVPAALGQVTARQLVAHTAGLRANHFSAPLWEDGDLAREVQSWDERIVIGDPGETRSHSHHGTALAGYVVESVVGKPFPDAMRELVWAPMGVRSGSSRIRDALLLPVAQGHRLEEGAMRVVEPFGYGFIGWPTLAFHCLDGMEGLALALAQPANAGVGNGGAPRPEWTGSWGWSGVHTRVIVDVERGFCALVADNGGGAAAELATAIERVALGRPEPPAPAPIDWRTPTPEALVLLPGVYENENTFEMALRDDELVVLTEQGEGEVRQGPDDQFEVVFSKRTVLVNLESTRNGKARHLRIGSRVWLRTGP